MIKKIAFILGFAILFGQQTMAQINVQQVQYQLPLLPQKKANPVLRLTIDNQSEETVDLEKLKLTITKGINELAQIQFIDKKDSSLLTNAQVQKAKSVSMLDVGKKSVIEVPFAYKLKPGKNYLWLLVKLKPHAVLNSMVGININHAIVNAKSYQVKYRNQLKQRIAFALRQADQDEVKSYRIPGLATAKDGTLLAVYDARRDLARDLQGNMDIGLSRSIDKGKTWLPMQIVLDMGEWGNLPQKFNGVSDASILVDKNTGTIYVAGLWMYGVINSEGKWIENLTESSTDWNHQWKTKGSGPGFDVKQTSQFLITKSTDHGKTWSKPVNITKMGKKEEWWLWAPAPGQGITLKDGTLVFPTQGRDKNGKPFSNITYSKDGGETWQSSNPAADEETTESMAVELNDGSIMLNMRANANKGDTTNRNGRAIAITADLGKTWKTHRTSHHALPEPVCMASIHKHHYKGKSVLIFCNPHSKTDRNFITLQVSKDDGETWQPKVLLDEWKGRGYSCITTVDEQTIGVVYESSQADLVFETIPLKNLIN
jgi:sialidase-1